MKNTSETQDFAFVTTALLTLISSLDKPQTPKEAKAESGLILSTSDLLHNYDYVMGVKNYLGRKLKNDFFNGPIEIFDAIGKIKLRPDHVSLAIDIGVRYLKKNEKITPDKISMIEEVSDRLGKPFREKLSYWLK